jgi:enoyl-CoA hydratase/carnithine racemase
MNQALPVLFRSQGTFAEIILNRPEKLNAIDLDCLTLMEQAVDSAESDDRIRALIVRGEGRAFCAGADLEYLEDKLADPEIFGAFLNVWHRVYGRIAETPLPTIAAVHGVALAGGFELLEACDFAVLADTAKIGDQHASYGLFPGGGGTQRLPRLIGERRAKWLLFTGEWIKPADALAYGLVNVVVPASEVESRCREMATVLANRSPRATASIKRAVRLGAATDLDHALEIERLIAVHHMQSRDAQIGLEAFRSRVEPRFD